MTAPGHCPTCFHHHQLGPTGRLVCGGSDGACSCNPSEPCRCTECTPAPERKPAAGWVDVDDEWHLKSNGGRHLATLWWAADCWRARVMGFARDFHDADRDAVESAQLAAEDALRAIGEEILRAVGK